jgi:aryl-alcohol dehydrogenase-like predicted oxidoreductase
VVIATKVGNPMGRGPNGSGYSKKHIIEGVEASLRRLRTDRIDLYQTHIWNEEACLEEMIDAFDLLVRQGKVLYIGATDIPCWQLAQSVYQARLAGKAAFTTLQHHYNAVWREDERDLIPFARSEGIGLLPYSPIARGFLAGVRDTERSRTDEYTRQWYGRPQDGLVAEAIGDIARRHGSTPAQIALAWVRAASPGAVPVVGAHSPVHLSALVSALDLSLSAEDMAHIGQHYAPRKRGGHF